MSPGRRTNRENLRSCQRTITLLLLLIFSSIKNRRLQPACFQSSARRPQPGDRIWCRRLARSRASRGRTKVFRDGSVQRAGEQSSQQLFRECENQAKSAQREVFRFWRPGGDRAAPGPSWVKKRGKETTWLTCSRTNYNASLILEACPCSCSLLRGVQFVSCC